MNSIDEATLLKMAEAELLGEAKKAALRHSIAGVSGWQPSPKPNKLFLTNTLIQTMASNRLFSKKQESSKQQFGSIKKKKAKERKLLQKNKKSTNFIFKKPEKIEIKICLDPAKRKGTKLEGDSKDDSQKTSIVNLKNEFKSKQATTVKR